MPYKVYRIMCCGRWLTMSVCLRKKCTFAMYLDGIEIELNIIQVAFVDLQLKFIHKQRKNLRRRPHHQRRPLQREHLLKPQPQKLRSQMRMMMVRCSDWTWAQSFCTSMFWILGMTLSYVRSLDCGF